jgi:Kyakuja-Dileera-Zisupton transposase
MYCFSCPSNVSLIFQQNDDDTLTWAVDAEQAGAADGDTEGTTCTDRWQAAMSDVLKRMWSIYRESGIFLSACRHGMIWLVVDMIRSGEL